MTLFSGAVLVAALAAAVLAVVQLARQQARLREELDELRTARVPETTPAKRTAEVRPMFGELYEAKPNPLEALGEWPGVPLAVAAAGLFAIGLFTNRPASAGSNPVDSTVARDIAAARMQYDSLAKEVDALGDSMTALRKPAAVAARAPEKKEKKLASRSVAQKPDVAPLPSLPKIAP
jgi:hypothetical protein